MKLDFYCHYCIHEHIFCIYFATVPCIYLKCLTQQNKQYAIIRRRRSNALSTCTFLLFRSRHDVKNSKAHVSIFVEEKFFVVYYETTLQDKRNTALHCNILKIKIKHHYFNDFLSLTKYMNMYKKQNIKQEASRLHHSLN